MYDNFNLLKLKIDRGVIFATIFNPPTNLLTPKLIEEFMRLMGEVAQDNEIKVIVFKSGDPDFFIAHFDVNELTTPPDAKPPKPDEVPPKSNELRGDHQMFLYFRSLPKITIAQIEGIIGGGGSEFAQSLDMRFGALGKMTVSQMEATVGIIPGGGGTQYLPRLMGSPRALEFMLSGRGYDAEIAERYGYLNRALPANKINGFVENLAYTIASFPLETIGLIKQAVRAAETLSLKEGLIEETYLFGKSLALPEAQSRMKLALEAGIQSRESELGIAKRTDEEIKDLLDTVSKK